MRASVLFVVPAFALAAAACSSTPPGEPDEPVGTTSSAIINGQLDTTHEAVVALILQQGQSGGLCSGTIVKVDAQRRIGWVVTAAHCVDVAPVLVVQGPDFLARDALRYDVIDYTADSRYTGQTSSSYDFAVVRIAGVDSKTPTIPLVTSPDGLGSGTPVVSVGYGRTTLIGSGIENENTRRRRVSKSLSQVGGTQIAYDMSSNGICQGDSGGPVLVESGGRERVAGVHSYVQGDCNGFGVSGRTTAGAAYFDRELTKPLPPEDCDLCGKIANSGNGECAVLTASCFADPECSGYYECLTQCGGSSTCRKRCAEDYPKAEGPFLAAANCVCTTACSDQCKGSPSCLGLPKCGYRLPAGDCASCTESSCCEETLACAADGTCYMCLKQNDEPSECASNAARKRLAACVAESCPEQCAGNGLDTGADLNSDEVAEGDGVTRRIITKKSCAVASPGLSGSGSFGLVSAALALGLVLRQRRRARPGA
jgi:hypothetical protein